MEKERLAPVVLFTYKREEHLRRTLNALNRNTLARQTSLFIYSDGAKGKEDFEAVEKTREMINQFAKQNFFESVQIIYSEKNKGLANSIISGVTDIIEKYGKIIVLEDDLATSSDFLNFMNDGLLYYKDMQDIGAISGYTLPLKQLKKFHEDIYFAYTGNSWGWATWADRWKKVDWEVKDYDSFKIDKRKRKQFNQIQYGITEMLDLQMNKKIDSWAVRWDYHFYKNSLLTVYPKNSKVSNEGFDVTGTHCSESGRKKYTRAIASSQYTMSDIKINRKLIKATAGYGKTSLCSQLLLKIARREESL